MRFDTCKIAKTRTGIYDTFGGITFWLGIGNIWKLVENTLFPIIWIYSVGMVHICVGLRKRGWHRFGS